ncbi:hypothetical protein TSAR_000573 [Trichomalopsis sarcophagae]|uniref:NADP-retinol dehydrogenase n=1 Tax=Trichomalopsis sarcophagae TaxID=543379 RepID=A0A232F458_9HYME|nr:hypothetical protein TSAR_000573 [Trichomalopsis sarcophagae]
MAPLPKTIIWGSTIASLTGFVYLLKDYNGGKKYEGNEKLTDKVVIVTGANTGIGKEVAHDLAKREARVIMACRDMFKCETARKQIVIDTKNKYVYCRKCDLASQESIRDFVKLFQKEHQKLHILINNAGVMRCPKSQTKEGIEMQLGVNHMGHFLLTNLLLDTLKASAPARIINVSSLAHARGKINTYDLNSNEHYDPAAAYAQSKLANVMFTKELAKRLKGTGVTANAVHPGIVDTELTRHMGYYTSGFSAIFLKPLIWPFIRTPKQGAQTILYAALSPELEKETGQYFSDCKREDVNPIAEKEDLVEWLWKTSEKWTHLSNS